MAQRKAAAVSMDPAMYERAAERAKSLGFSTFSAYVVQLLRADLRERGELTLKEEAETTPPPKTRPAKKVDYAEQVRAAKKRAKAQPKRGDTY